MRKYNSHYKDSVFVDLFSNDKTAKDSFLALYNVLYATHYHSTDILKNIRLKALPCFHGIAKKASIANRFYSFTLFRFVFSDSEK